MQIIVHLLKKTGKLDQGLTNDGGQFFCLFCFLIPISETPNPLPIMDIVPWSIKRQICVHPRLLCYFRLKCARVGPKQPPKYSSFLMHVLFDLYFPFANLMDPNFGYLVLCGQIILPETFLLITCPNNIYWSFFLLYRTK